MSEPKAEKTPRRKASFWQRLRTIREQPGSAERLLWALLCISLLLTLWYVVTAGPAEKRIVNAFTLPSLGDTLRSFPELWFDRALARGAFWSLSRVLAGFLLAASIAVPLGVVAASYRRVHAFLNPLSIFGRNIPIAALIPLTMIWFGLGETQKVMFIFFTSVAFIFFDSVNATDAVSDCFLDTAYTLGARSTPLPGLTRALLIGLVYGIVFASAAYLLADQVKPSIPQLALSTLSGWGIGALIWLPITSNQVVSKVLLPLALPDIVNSLRLLFGLAFGYIMLAEVINAKHGLGSIIIVSQRRGMGEHIYLSLIIIALLAFALDRLVLALQHRGFPYKAGGHR